MEDDAFSLVIWVLIRKEMVVVMETKMEGERGDEKKGRIQLWDGVTRQIWNVALALNIIIA